MIVLLMRFGIHFIDMHVFQDAESCLLHAVDEKKRFALLSSAAIPTFSVPYSSNDFPLGHRMNFLTLLHCC